MTTTIDSREVAKFVQLADVWWNTEGPLKTLHDINPARLGFIQSTAQLYQQRVLDAGCGGGILAESMAKHGAYVTGLDVDAALIDMARSHGSMADYVCLPLEHFEAELFDVITCMEMLEHVPTPVFVIEHAARLLKKGGYLFLSTINRTLKAYLQVILAGEYILNLLPRQTHDYDKFIKPSELEHITRINGLELIALTGLHYNPLTRGATLSTSVEINYLMACRKL